MWVLFEVEASTVMCSIMVATFYEVCLFPSKLESWFKLIVHLVASKNEILDAGFALGVHTHLQIGV